MFRIAKSLFPTIKNNKSELENIQFYLYSRLVFSKKVSSFLCQDFQDLVDGKNTFFCHPIIPNNTARGKLCQKLQDIISSIDSDCLSANNQILLKYFTEIVLNRLNQKIGRKYVINGDILKFYIEKAMKLNSFCFQQVLFQKDSLSIISQQKNTICKILNKGQVSDSCAAEIVKNFIIPTESNAFFTPIYGSADYIKICEILPKTVIKSDKKGAIDFYQPQDTDILYYYSIIIKHHLCYGEYNFIKQSPFQPDKYRVSIFANNKYYILDKDYSCKQYYFITREEISNFGTFIKKYNGPYSKKYNMSLNKLETYLNYRGKKLYSKKSILEQENEGKRFVAVEIEDKMRYFFVCKNIHKYSENFSNLTFHEYISGSCRFYADLDDHDNRYSVQEFNEKIEFIKTNAGRIFNKVFGVYTKMRFVITKNYTNYCSARIFIQVDNYYFDSPYKQIKFWRKFKLDILDMQVYRKGMLRYWNCNKYQTNDTAHNIFGKVKYARACCEKNGIELKPIYKYGAFASEYEQIIARDAMKNMENPILYYKYNKDMQDQMPVRKFDKKQNWIDLIRYIKCIFVNLSNEERIKLINSYMHKFGWDSEANFLENTVLYRKISEYPVKLKEFLEFINVKPVKYDVVYEDKIARFLPITKPGLKYFLDVDYTIEDRMKNRIIQVVKSPCDTQKSRGIIQTYYDKKVMFIQYRTSISYNISGEHKIEKTGETIFVHNYEDLVEGLTKEGKLIPQFVSVQIESLYKFEKLINEYEIIVIDEANHVLDQFNHVLSMEKNNKYKEVCSVFKRFMLTKNIIFMSANINDMVFKFIKEICGEETIHSSLNTYVSKDWEFNFINNKFRFFGKFQEALSEGKKIIIPTNSKSISETIAAKIHYKLPNIKYKLINAANEKEFNFKKDWADYDCIIYSPSIEAGFSFTELHFDEIYAYFKNTSNNHLSCFQMLFRCRNIKSSKVFIYADEVPIKMLGSETDELGEKQIFFNTINKTQMSEYNIIKQFGSINYEYFDQYTFCFSRNLMLTKLFSDYSKLRLRKNLMRELKDQGYKVIPGEIIKINAAFISANLDFAKKNKELRKKYRALIFNSFQKYVENNKNYLTLTVPESNKELLSKENGYISTIYKKMQFDQPENSEKFEEAMNQYKFYKVSNAGSKNYLNVKDGLLFDILDFLKSEKVFDIEKDEFKFNNIYNIQDLISEMCATFIDKIQILFPTSHEDFIYTGCAWNTVMRKINQIMNYMNLKFVNNTPKKKGASSIYNLQYAELLNTKNPYILYKNA